MGMIINAGSENKGGTVEESLVIANEYLEQLHSNGFVDVELMPEVEVRDGLWCYTFRHAVTGKTATLDTHGFTEDECHKFMFRPRIYWNGSSSSEPTIEDWLTNEYSYKIAYIPKSV